MHKSMSKSVRKFSSCCGIAPHSRAANKNCWMCWACAMLYLNYKRHIVPLLDQGLLAMTLPDKPTSRLQRYRTTAQGQALLAQIAADVAAQEKPAP